jgi:hypothetical protein
MSAWGVSFGTAWADSWGATVTTPAVFTSLSGGGGGGGTASVGHKRRKRDDIEQDIRDALDRLEHTTKAAEVLAVGNGPAVRAEAIAAKLAEDIDQAEQALIQSVSKVERTRLQLSIAEAVDVRIHLVARNEATKAIARARGRRAAAFLAVILASEGA